MGVPGTAAGWAEILAGHGTMDLDEVLAPAVQVARAGFEIDQTFYDQTTQNRDRFDDFTSTRALFLDPDGQPHPVGTVLRNPDLAGVLEALAADGPSVFYGGDLAARLVETVRNPPLRPGATRNVRPGRMTVEDLDGYRPVWRDPVRTSLPRLRDLRDGPAQQRRARRGRGTADPRRREPGRHGPHPGAAPGAGGVPPRVRRP